tara:strand:- start:378265 stop:379722 length:1458 start_codon:yes stop_codon:yes gene_type:complete
MPPRNLNVILLAVFLSVLCYITHRRTKTALLVGSALDLIRHNYVDPVDDETLLTAAMNGLTESLDENSTYIPGSAYGSFQDSINQEFAGIGIFVEQPDLDEPVRVITPLVGSPALKAGLLPGDKIINVDGEDVRKLTLAEVSERLRGPVDTTVRLRVLRDDDKEVSMTVRRQTIELESVIGDHRDEEHAWVYRLKDDPSIAYMRLTSFGEKTVQELRDVLEKLDNDFRGLVLDLRGNSGGLLYAAVDVSNMFIESGKIVSTRIRGDVVEEQIEAEPGTLVDPSKPVAVLIDGNSASASEIVAACLQDNGRAVVVGTRSYGKGTVQNILPLQYGRSALRLTVARYYRPNDKNIHRMPDATEEDEWGVTPDEGYVVPLDEETLQTLMQRWREASYPMLTARRETSDKADDESQAKMTEPEPEPESVSESEPESEVKTDGDIGGQTETRELQENLPAGGLPVDPQLQRAVDYLNERLSSRGKEPRLAA